MYRILILCICMSTALADDGHGFGGGFGGGFTSTSIKAPAFVLPIPEIGFTFDKLPLFLPIPKIVLGKRSALVSKPLFFGSSDFGFGHGSPFGLSFGSGFGHGLPVKHITITEGHHGHHEHHW